MKYLSEIQNQLEIFKYLDMRFKTEAEVSEMLKTCHPAMISHLTGLIFWRSLIEAAASDSKLVRQHSQR